MKTESCACSLNSPPESRLEMNARLAQAEAQIFKALGHPSRIILVDALKNGERCVCDLAYLVPGQLPTVSRHLALLKSAGIIIDRKQGQNVFYRLNFACVNEFIACIAAKLGE